MSILYPTVTVEAIKGHNAVRMLWGREVDPDDVEAAFQQVMHWMERSTGPLDVVLDIYDSTQFPLLKAIDLASSGPAVHRNMGRWIVVGSSGMSRAFARTLSLLDGMSRVRVAGEEARKLENLDQILQEVSPALAAAAR